MYIISYVISGSRGTILEEIVVKDIPDPCLGEKVRKVQYIFAVMFIYCKVHH
jgi:hypothetical protein